MYHIYNAIKILDFQKSETVILEYRTYRALFSAFEVEPVEEIYDRHNNLVSVKVDRLKALKFLMDRYNFVRNKDLEKRIQEAARGKEETSDV